MLDIEEIKSLLPHRYPFLMIDRVLELEDDHIVTIKNVTVNEEYFNGHFPGASLMPGVLQVEAMAQSGALMTLSSKKKTEDISDIILVFSGIKQAKFRKPVVPGDQLRMDVKLVSERRNFLIMQGSATVDDQITCELEATAALVSKENI